MNVSERINLLEVRLHKLSARDKDNAGVRRKLLRELNNLKKMEAATQ